MPTSSHNSDYDAIHQGVGDALDGWSRVEQALEHLFVGLTSADTWDAHLIMVSVVSFDARLKICNSLMQRRRSLKTVERWDALYNKLDRKYRKRSELAHGSVIQLNSKLVLIPYFTVGRTMKRYVGKDAESVEPLLSISAKEIAERAAGFRALAATLNEFTLDLVAEREQLQASRAQAADQDSQPDQNDHSPKES